MNSMIYFSALISIVSLPCVVASIINDSVEEIDRTVIYGEYCNHEGPICNQHKGLECEDEKCTCKNNSESGDKLVHIEEDIGCLPIASFSDGWACKYDEQCRQSNFGNNSFCLKYISSEGVCTCKPQGDPCLNSSRSFSQNVMSSNIEARPCTTNLDCTSTILGKLSRCNKLSEQNNCECFDTEGKGRPIVLGFDNTCYVQKIIDQSCKNDQECNATISGEAICLGSADGTKSGVCKCALGYQFDEGFRECLKLGTINSSCKSDLQCHNLGQLTYCSQVTKKCICWDVPGKGEKMTKFYEGRCHYSRRENETCNDKTECMLGFHPNADCWVHDSFNNERVCQCSEGSTCSNAQIPYASLFYLVISSFITLAFTN